LDAVTRIIVWDVDDVLNDLMRLWFEWWSSEHDESSLRYEDLVANPPDSLLGLTHSEYVASLDRFRLGDAYARLAPNDDILGWLRVHGLKCRHMALTATSLQAAPMSASWVIQYFGVWIREFGFIPARRVGQAPPSYDVDKGSWVQRIGPGAILIDDSDTNVAAARALGIDAICWPRPWNESTISVSQTLDLLTDLVESREYPRR
jgi:FMN phosphatase YigB (HAD superfamily)